MIGTDLLRLVPEGTSHFVVEKRQHRGNELFAVISVVPHGSTIVLNTYSSRELATDTARLLAEALSARCSICRTTGDHSLSCPTRWYV